LSWQTTPTILLELIEDKDPAKAKPVFEAMLKMKKIDIATLKQAAAQA
jgi:predicted 3-demethylubiquinone-9 3-methyltransferase (glyoxalase superfamily)